MKFTTVSTKDILEHGNILLSADYWVHYNRGEHPYVIEDGELRPALDSELHLPKVKYFSDAVAIEYAETLKRQKEIKAEFEATMKFLEDGEI